MYSHNYIEDHQCITKYGQPMKAQEICADLQNLWRENQRLEQCMAEQLAERERLVAEQSRLTQQLMTTQQQLIGLGQQAIQLLQGMDAPLMRERV